MVLIDTSVWVNVFNDKQGDYSRRLYESLGGRAVFLTRFQQLELLQGSRNEQEWSMLSDYLATQDYLEAQEDTWQAAARLYYELRRKGITVRSPIDCCVAQIALEHKMLLIHDDRDFMAIASHFPLQHQHWPRDESVIHEDASVYASKSPVE